MNLLKRLKNLWKLSAYTPSQLKNPYSTIYTEDKDVFSEKGVLTEQKLATIVEMTNPLDVFDITKDNDETN